MSQQVLRELKKRLKYLSVSQLAVELGYRSPNTVVNWVKKNRIPATALLRVSKYLKGASLEYFKNDHKR